MTSQRLLSLRFPGTCLGCGRDLPAATKACWDSQSRTVTCVACEIETPADPFQDVDPGLRGTAGGSAQAEHDRPANKPNSSPDSAYSWQKGADGECQLSEVLHREAGNGRLIVLDDRLIPGTRRNIDHIAVAPSGAYVVDAKNYSGKVERRVDGFLRWRTEHLIVGGRDRTKLVAGVKGQVETVRAVLNSLHEPTDVPIVPVLCFVGSDNWELLSLTLTVDGVKVLWPRALKKLLRQTGSLDGKRRALIARLLSTQLPPAS
jgi:hypothetical protein